jgi:hypothetical protein
MLRQALQLQLVARCMENCLSRNAQYVDSSSSISVSPRWTLASEM